MPGGSCISPHGIAAATYAHSAVSAAADWTFGILPVFLIWDVKMNPQTKISIAIILGLGAIGSTATLVRIKFIDGLTKPEDFLYNTLDVAIWSTVEPGVGIIAASIPTLRPLFKTFFTRVGISSNSRGGQNLTNSRMSPWPHNRSGYQRSHPLNDLRPEGGPVTTTTVEASRRGRGHGSGQGNWLRGASSNHGDETSEKSLESGISKTVGITYAETPRLREGV
ncbi:hypothetical protein MMC16_005975 [Acarospora aff. strigata]|nr:hypothetical protein [Acarospora aff. strigata]